MKREEMGTHPTEISAFPPVLLRGLDPRDANPEESSGFPSRVPNKRGVTAAAAPSGRFITKALGDLEEGETDCIMGLSATMQSLTRLLSQHSTSSAPPDSLSPQAASSLEFNRCSFIVLCSIVSLL